MNPKRFLARRCGQIEFSGIRKVYDLAQRLKDPIDLSIGQPDYDAPDAVKDAAIAAIRAGHNRYTPTAGLPALRKALASATAPEFGGDEPAVLVTVGVSGGLLLALLATIEPGDEVVFLDPYFVSYMQLVRMVGGTPVAVPSYPDFAFPAEAVERAITPRTKLLLINSPGNPTGRVMSEAEIKSAAAIARKHDLLLLSDEIYNEMSYDGPSASPVAHAPERTILLRGFGKTYGVTGWRMGYVAGPQPLVDEMLKMQQYTYVCAPSMAQHAMLTAMKTDTSRHRRDYARKRDLVVKALSGVFELTKPSGGFYVFPKAPARFASATEFCEAAAERKVLIIPGSVFSARDTHFRISYAVPDEMCLKGCELLCETARG